jgi:hypothetical protein
MALADPEVLPEPDACEECDVCCTDVEDAPGEKILRCSVCKDRFYCVRRLSALCVDVMLTSPRVHDARRQTGSFTSTPVLR